MAEVYRAAFSPFILTTNPTAEATNPQPQTPQPQNPQPQTPSPTAEATNPKNDHKILIMKPKPENILEKPSPETIDVNMLSKSVSWGGFFDKHSYIDDRKTIAEFFVDKCNDSNVPKEKFDQIIRIDMHHYHRDIPHTLHKVEESKKTYGIGVDELFHHLYELDLFERLDKDVNTIIKSEGFLYYITEYAQASGLLLTDRHLPFAEMSVYLLEEFDDLVGKYLGTEGGEYTDIKEARNALVKALQGISSACGQYEKTISAKTGDEAFYQEFLNSDLLKSILPGLLKEFNEAVESFRGLIDKVIKEEKVDEKYMKHVYMADLYILTLRSMVETIIDIKDYKRRTVETRMGGVGTHTHILSKDLSTVAINIFMFVIGKNDKYYENVQKRHQETWEPNFHGFKTRIRDLRRKIVEDFNEILKGGHDRAKVDPILRKAEFQVQKLMKELKEFKYEGKKELSEDIDDIKSLISVMKDYVPLLTSSPNQEKPHALPWTDQIPDTSSVQKTLSQQLAQGGADPLVMIFFGCLALLVIGLIVYGAMCAGKI